MGKLTIVHHTPDNPGPFAKAMIFLAGSWIPRPGSTTIDSGPRHPTDASPPTPATPAGPPQTNDGL